MFLLNLLIDLYFTHSQAFTLQREPIRPLQAAAKLQSFQESPKQITDFLLVIPSLITRRRVLIAYLSTLLYRLALHTF